MWFIEWIDGNEYTIKHHPTNRYLSAWHDAARDYQVTTVEEYTTWRFEKLADDCTDWTGKSLKNFAKCDPVFECGEVDDGCGGKLVCGPPQGLGNCTGVGINVVTGAPDICVEHACVCDPRTA